MKNQNWDLKPIHKEVLDILWIFQEICKKYNLKYYALFGTVLGAVRHQGFIPWDDDLDVAMPREDFNKFVDVVGKELPEHLQFSRGGGSLVAPVYFSKIWNNKPGIIDELGKATNFQLKYPPFIDVFVLDGVPSKVGQLRKWWMKRRCWRLCQLYRYPWTSTVQGFKGQLKKCLSRFIGFFLSFFYRQTHNNDEMLTILDEIAMEYPYASADVVTEISFYANKVKYLMPRSFFGEGKLVPFEGGEICIPEFAHGYLMAMYGDYMQLPPVECRIPEHNFGYQG